VVGAGGELAGQEGREGGGCELGVKMWKDEFWSARRWRRGWRILGGSMMWTYRGPERWCIEDILIEISKDEIRS